ncbi:rubredoxin [Pseudomonas protegens]|jgi:rubredoxin|uniref:Rubredoxin n=4 Tax=Pseudomonas TaxID=286 RepID=Q4KK21_PSEF5|nr:MULTISPECIES: rubredoxin [Pseudomonas]BCQ58593.1 rubredoxin [Pseudomonas sp. Boi14]AAY95677.1 rubredoxin [Pseudomonas protegens Pf-5]AGL82072.1 rubredoxin [Pseudomonas protegens CHA0]ASE20183.1 rubredoxin [Pseudomonas protegens]MBB1613613.1 rubredoxin [Pseudomonas sp. UMC65]
MSTYAENAVAESGLWMCLICGWIYDQRLGDPDSGVPPGTAWDDIAEDWTCPECGVSKLDFNMVKL